MQRESQMQVNLREKIQTFIYAFQEENDLGNVIPDYLFLNDLIKKGIIINQSQLPDLYSKLQIPIDKRKAFYLDDYELFCSESVYGGNENSHYRVNSCLGKKTNDSSKPSSYAKFHFEEKEETKRNNRFPKKLSPHFNFYKDTILFPLVPYRIQKPIFCLTKSE